LPVREGDGRCLVQSTAGRHPVQAGNVARLAQGSSYRLLFGLLALGLAISGVPSPLDAVYQREWGSAR
jgi:hypothetical protein